jgi:hypothetical protein
MIEIMISARGVLVLVVCVGMREEVNSDVSAKMDLIKLYAILIRPHPQVRENNSSITYSNSYLCFFQLTSNIKTYLMMGCMSS